MERMDFTQFCEAIRDGIAEYLLQYDIEQLRLEQVCHNNGIEHTGLVILKKGENTSPTIYLEQFYSGYRQGIKTFDEILQLIAQEYKHVLTRMEKQGELTVDMEHVLDHVFLRLVNYQKNREMLMDCPYIPFHDMAITFRYLVKMDENGIASALLYFSNLQDCDITIDELYRAARENTLKLFPPFVKRLDEFLEDRYPQNGSYPETPEIYILSNQQFIYGATMMIYKDVIAAFADHVDKDVYIIPSSVNEVLLCIADSNMERAMLENTLHEVNEFVVSGMDYLSDEVYFYDKQLGNIVA